MGPGLIKPELIKPLIGIPSRCLYFQAYVAQRGYNLHTILEYGKIVQDAGFRNVSAVDETDFMVKMLHEELEKLANMKEAFIKVQWRF